MIRERINVIERGEFSKGGLCLVGMEGKSLMLYPCQQDQRMVRKKRQKQGVLDQYWLPKDPQYSPAPIQKKIVMI